MLGLTPVDTGYTYAGYVLAGSIMSYFKVVYVVAAIGGLIWMVYHSLLSGSLKPLFVYFITLMLVVSIFMPRTSLPAPVSAGERKASISSREVAQQILGSNYSVKTSLGLVWIGRFLDALCITTAKLIESGGAIRKEGRVVGGIPFLYARAYTEVMGAKIKDPKVRSEFLDFLAGPYARALQKWVDAGRPGLGFNKSVLFPGDLIAKYGTPQELSQWRSLQEKIYMDFTKRNEFNSKFIPPFWKKFIIIKTVKNELASKETITSVSERILTNSLYSGGKGGVWRYLTSPLAGVGVLGVLLSTMGRILTGAIIPAIPTVQGILNFMVLIAFPFVLLFSLFPNNFRILPKYFLTLLWVKSLTVAWAIINCFQNLGWLFASASGQSTFAWNLGSIPLIGVLAGIFLLPFLFFKIIAEGLAYVEGIITRSATEGAGRVVSKVAEKGMEATK